MKRKPTTTEGRHRRGAALPGDTWRERLAARRRRMRAVGLLSLALSVVLFALAPICAVWLPERPRWTIRLFAAGVAALLAGVIAVRTASAGDAAAAAQEGRGDRDRARSRR